MRPAYLVVLLALAIGPAQQAFAWVSTAVADRRCDTLTNEEDSSPQGFEWWYSETPGLQAKAHANALTPHRVNAAAFAQNTASVDSTVAVASASVLQELSVTSDDPGLLNRLITATLAAPSYRGAETRATCSEADFVHRSTFRQRADVALNSAFSALQIGNESGISCDPVTTTTETQVSLRVGSTYAAQIYVQAIARNPYDLGNCTLYSGQKAQTSITAGFGGIRDIRDSISGAPLAGVHLIASDGTDYTNGIPIPKTCENAFDDDIDDTPDFPGDEGCSSEDDSSERKPSCGLGAELVLVMPLLGVAAGRKRAAT